MFIRSSIDEGKIGNELFFLIDAHQVSCDSVVFRARNDEINFLRKRVKRPLANARLRNVQFIMEELNRIDSHVCCRNKLPVHLFQETKRSNSRFEVSYL